MCQSSMLTEECTNLRVLFNRSHYLLFEVLKGINGDRKQFIEALIAYMSYTYDLEALILQVDGLDERAVEDIKLLFGQVKALYEKIEQDLSVQAFENIEHCLRFELPSAMRLVQDYTLIIFGYSSRGDIEREDFDWYLKAISVTVTTSARRVVVEVRDGETSSQEQLLMTGFEKSNADYLFYWLLLRIKPLFKRMPAGALNIQFTYADDVANNFGLKKYFSVLYGEIEDLLFTTNRLMADLYPMRGVFAEGEKTLFFIFDTEMKSRMGGFIKHWDSIYPEASVVKTFPSGWDQVQRKWVKNDYRFRTQALIADLIQHDVRQVVGLNHYYIDNAIGHERVFITSILEMLGIRLVHFNFDPVEFEPYGQLRRKTFTTEAVTRFSVLPVLSHEWDKRFEQPGMYYSPIIEHYNDLKKFGYQALKEDYKVLVLSQSRINYVKTYLQLMLYVFENLKSDNLFRDYQLWFLAMRKRLINELDFDEKRLMRCGEMLHELMYAMVSFFKFDVIHQIKTDRPIEIYGDLGWSIAFPEYYQDKYLNAEEIEALDASNSYLHLLFHNSFNYLETGGPVYDALAKGRAFINYSALVKTDAFEGFSNVEYDSPERINELIANYKVMSQSPALASAIEAYFDLMGSSEKEIAAFLYEGAALKSDIGVYYEACQAHYELLDPLVDDFTNEHKDFLVECEAYVYDGLKPDYAIETGQYYDRPYVRNIHQIER